MAAAPRSGGLPPRQVGAPATTDGEAVLRLPAPWISTSATSSGCCATPFATSPAEVAPVAEELDRSKSFPYELVAKMGELGLMGIPFPEEYGGGGADTLSYALAVEELTRVDSSVAITMAAHTSLGTMPIHLWGTDEQRDDWLPQLCAGRSSPPSG